MTTSNNWADGDPTVVLPRRKKRPSAYRAGGLEAKITSKTPRVQLVFLGNFGAEAFPIKASDNSELSWHSIAQLNGTATLRKWSTKEEKPRADHLGLFCQNHMHRVLAENIFGAVIAESSHVNAGE